MSIDRAVMAFAGFMVLLSVALTHFFSPYWLLSGGEILQDAGP